MQVNKGDVAIVIFVGKDRRLQRFYARALIWREFRVANNLLTLEFAYCIAPLLWYYRITET